jgi:GMP synthase-like glutamine amidotransferase
MTLRVALIDCGSRKVPELARLLELQGAACTLVALAEVDPRELGRCDALVISGGPHLFTAAPELVERFAFIDELALPMLGICLGHQAIGLRRGASAFLGEARRAPERIEIVAAHPLLEGLGSSTTLGADHCEGISLPAGFELLASSRHYPVEIMAARQAPVFGVQCHPEISGEPGALLLRNFLAIARATLGAPDRGR